MKSGKKITCSTNRKAFLARSYGAALLMACSAADQPSDADMPDVSDEPAEMGRPPVDAEFADDELLVINQERIDRLVESAHAQTVAAPGDGGRGLEVAAVADAEGDFRARRAARFSDEERSHAIELVEAVGIAAERVSFFGQLVFVDGDAQLELSERAGSTESGALGAEIARAVLPRELELASQLLRLGVIEKGKVLGQIVTTGTPPLAPVVYAQQSGGSWLFNRPDLEQNVLLIPDSAPAFVFNDFVTAVAVVASASSGDCIGADFMVVMRQATYDALPAQGKATLRTKSVVYAPAACPAGYSACAQFPLVQMVTLTPGGVPRERFVTGRRIGIDSLQITKSTSSSRATFVHELLHTLGIAHPKAESFGSGDHVTKLVVPGTLSGSCVVAPCAAGTNYPSIMHQALDLGRTNSLQPDDVDVIATLYASAGGCSYRATPRVVTAQ